MQTVACAYAAGELPQHQRRRRFFQARLPPNNALIIRPSRGPVLHFGCLHLFAGYR